MTGPPTGRAHRRGERPWALGGSSTHERSRSSSCRPPASPRRGASRRCTRWRCRTGRRRDLGVLLRQRSRLPVDALPIVATIDRRSPSRSTQGSSRSGATCPSTARSGRGPAAFAHPYDDGSANGASSTRRRRARGVLPRGAQRPASRWACTRSVTARSSRCSPRGNASTRRWTRASGGISGRAGTGSSTSRWSRPTRSSERPCSGWPRRSNRRSTGCGGRRGGHVRAAARARARARPMNPFRTMLERGVEVGVGVGRPGHAARSDARDRLARRPSRAGAAVSRAVASGCTRSGRERVGPPGGEEGALAPGHACRLRRVRRRSAGRWLARGPPPGAHGLARPRGLRGLSSGRIAAVVLVTVSGHSGLPCPARRR